MSRMDWQAALERSRAAEQPRNIEDPAVIYKRRAQRLANPLEGAGHALEVAELQRGHLPLLVFRLGAQRYAIPGSAVIEVMREARVTPVPGAAPWVAGAMQVRGDIWPVYRLAGRLNGSGGTEQAAADGNGPVMLLAQAAGKQFGLPVDEAIEMRSVSTDDIDETAPGRGEHIRGYTRDLVAIVDLESLWKS